MKGLVSAFQCQTSDFNLIIWRFEFPIEKITHRSAISTFLSNWYDQLFTRETHKFPKKNRPKQVESSRLDQKQVDNWLGQKTS